MYKNIFEIVKVTSVTEDSWLVEGRAYEDIKVGDIVFIEIAESANEKRRFQFKVIAAITYGREVPELNRALTGGLALTGANGEKLKEATMLVARLA